MLYFFPLYLWGCSYKKPCKLVILYFLQYYYYRIIMYNTYSHTQKEHHLHYFDSTQIFTTHIIMMQHNILLGNVLMLYLILIL